MPLHQDIEGGHGEREPRLKILPHAVHDVLEVADERQHREHRLHEHPVLPLAALTQFEIARIALGGMEASVTQNNHLFFALANQPVALHLTVVTSTTVPSGVSGYARDAHVAGGVSSVAAAHETPGVPGSSNKDW